MTLCTSQRACYSGPFPACHSRKETRPKTGRRRPRSKALSQGFSVQVGVYLYIFSREIILVQEPALAFASP